MGLFVQAVLMRLEETLQSRIFKVHYSPVKGRRAYFTSIVCRKRTLEWMCLYIISSISTNGTLLR